MLYASTGIGSICIPIHKRLMKSFIGIVFLISSMSCTNLAIENEIINPPVNVQVSRVTGSFTYYQITFQADNRENKAQGYGIFVASAGSGQTATEAATALVTQGQAQSQAKTTDAGLFCSGRAGADTRFHYTVQVGGSSLVSGINCPSDVADLGKITLFSGMGVAVATRVDRDSNPWSLPATAIVP